MKAQPRMAIVSAGEGVAITAPLACEARQSTR